MATNVNFDGPDFCSYSLCSPSVNVDTSERSLLHLRANASSSSSSSSSPTSTWGNFAFYDAMLSQNASDASYRLDAYEYEYPTVWEPSAEEQMYLRIEEILMTRVVVTVSLIGIAGNLLTMFVLLRRLDLNAKKSVMRRRHVAQTDISGLIALTVSDLLLCVAILPQGWTNFGQSIYTSLTFAVYYRQYENAVINSFVMTSTWLTVAMTTNRYLHLCHPLWGLRYCGPRFVKVSMVTVVSASFFFNLPRYWLLEISHCACPSAPPFIVHSDTGHHSNASWYDDVNSGVTGSMLYGFDDGALKRQPHLVEIYDWLFFIVGIMAPLVVLAFCNCRIVRVLCTACNSSRVNAERTLITKTLIGIVILYLVLVSPAELVKFFRRFVADSSAPPSDGGGRNWTPIYNLTLTVANTLQALNFSCNFLPYLFLDKTFRKMLYGSRATTSSVGEPSGRIPLGYRAWGRIEGTSCSTRVQNETSF